MGRGERTVRAASSLAEQRVAAIANQLETADSARNVGLAMLTNIRLVMAGPPHGYSVLGNGVGNESRMAAAMNFTASDVAACEDYDRARAALAMINADKDTLTGLARAATGLLAGADEIQRKALSMDVIKPKGDPAIPSEMGQKMRAVMARLRPETLMKLREAAVEISRLPPQPDGGKG